MKNTPCPKAVVEKRHCEGRGRETAVSARPPGVPSTVFNWRSPVVPLRFPSKMKAPPTVTSAPGHQARGQLLEMQKQAGFNVKRKYLSFLRCPNYNKSLAVYRNGDTAAGIGKSVYCFLLQSGCPAAPPGLTAEGTRPVPGRPGRREALLSSQRRGAVRNRPLERSLIPKM